MSEGWKRVDLEGGGLQAVNMRLAGRLKRRRRAYALWAAFPLGLHHVYLENPAGAWLFRGLTLLAAALAFFDWRAAAAAGVVMVLLALYDLAWIDRRVVGLNKAIRRNVFLSAGAIPPDGFRGRYDDAEHAPVPPPRRRGQRVLSFAEQEKLLRELAERTGRERGKPDGD
jgi:hypothetical protein